MKKLRNSFTLLVALVTIGITLMSNRSIVANKQNLYTDRCYKPSIYVGYLCQIGQRENLHSTLLCSFASAFEGAHVFNINPLSYIEPADIVLECYGGDYFCCAQVEEESQICLDQPAFNLEGYFGYYKISHVYCKWD